ncbi:MAG: class I SAM-dependent methyltransferase [Candidatus Omnitrophica bacterium]|nr:class I SAM-dependent methyltransferase [Candidatus Omnitrophota bacterium]
MKFAINDSSHKGNYQNLPRGFITPEKAKRQAETLANSVKNHFRHLSKRFNRQGIHCFRLYDWDSPDIRVVVDWYAGHLVVAEYERIQTGPEYLPQMANAAAQALGVPPEKVHIRRRHTNTVEGPRYAKIDSRGERIEVHERNLRFWVNLNDFLDTGLFSDHRDTRAIIIKLSAGKDFLNLFCYTGTFTCAAAAGGCASSVSVDRSKTYLDWARDNLALNGFLRKQHTLIQADVMSYLAAAHKRGERFNLAFVDPPSFYKDERAQVSFDINRDHPQLLSETLKLMQPGSDLFFSTNHQRFAPQFENLAVKDIAALTPKTIPEDYRNRMVHSCWHMKT